MVDMVQSKEEVWLLFAVFRSWVCLLTIIRNGYSEGMEDSVIKRSNTPRTNYFHWIFKNLAQTSEVFDWSSYQLPFSLINSLPIVLTEMRDVKCKSVLFYCKTGDGIKAKGRL